MRRIAVTGSSGFIGTNVVEALARREDVELLGLDLAEPRDETQRRYWKKCDLLEVEELRAALKEFQPTEVVHLGGRTDMFGKELKDYAANHVGTENLIAVLQGLGSVERVVFTSSQFVVGPGALPTSDTEFRPHTIYGESKVKSEEAVRAAELDFVWTIIRPTNIWGKWHPRYPNEFWKVLKQGRYVHPGGRSVRRCYGYVGTIVEQIETILTSAPEVVDRSVFYVGDAPMDLLDWTNAFSLELTGKPVHVVPRPVLRTLAFGGDVVIACGGRFPIFSSRYRSMTEDYVTPMEKTFERLGTPRISLEQGVRETAVWLRSTGSFWS